MLQIFHGLALAKTSPDFVHRDRKGLALYGIDGTLAAGLFAFTSFRS
jgi:hypothetical protein